MSVFKLFQTIFVVLFFAIPAAHAEIVRLSTSPDGQIRFNVSLSGPTRISVVGDRIAKVLQSQSAFEMVNDEGTGDVFLRYSGNGGQVTKESGYLVTESGVTVGFVMTPKTGIEMQTVLVTIKGSRGSASLTSKTSGFAVNAAPAATANQTKAPAQQSQSRTDKLAQFVRTVHARRIADKSPGRLRAGNHTSYSSGGLRARVLVANAAGGNVPHPQSFYRSKKTIAVWVGDQVANGKVWVIIVEGKV